LLDSATLFSKVISSKSQIDFKNEITVIFAEFSADPIDTSKVSGWLSNKLEPFLAFTRCKLAYRYAVYEGV